MVYRLVTLLACLLALAPQALAEGCALPDKPAEITVALDATQPGTDHAHIRRELHNFDISTVSPYGSNRQVHVNGLMRGAISLETQSAIAWQRSANGENNCFWFDHINLTLKLSPTIYIAREIPEQTCLYREVLQHEYKHYYTDMQIAKDMQYTLKSELANFVNQMGVLGPYASQMQASAKGELMQRLSGIVNGINERMKVERMRRQALIDTMQEYDRVAQACPNERNLM